MLLESKGERKPMLGNACTRETQEVLGVEREEQNRVIVYQG